MGVANFSPWGDPLYPLEVPLIFQFRNHGDNRGTPYSHSALKEQLLLTAYFMQGLCWCFSRLHPWVFLMMSQKPRWIKDGTHLRLSTFLWELALTGLLGDLWLFGGVPSGPAFPGRPSWCVRAPSFCGTKAANAHCLSSLERTLKYPSKH